MGKIDYSEEFKERVKKEFPDDVVLHELLSAGDPQACIYLSQEFKWSESERDRIAIIAMTLWNECYGA